MSAPKIKSYVVTGSGRFPLDMLRYDACWPVHESETMCIEASLTKRINVLSVTLNSLKDPTPERWESFGYTVMSDVRAG